MIKGFINFTKEKSKIIPFEVTEQEIKSVYELHKSRWDNAKTIKGTQSYHQFGVDPSDKKFIFVKNISKSEQFKRVKVFKR